MRVTDAVWFQSLWCVGVVLVDTGHGFKAYIGVGKGLNEETDQQAIAQYGARFHQAAALWPHVKEWLP